MTTHSLSRQYPMIDPQQPAHTPSNRDSERRTQFAVASLLLCLVIGIAYAALRPTWYEWVLSKKRVRVVVHCDTTVFRGGEVKAFALYDKVALSPLARMTGLYQNRSIDRVRSFHLAPIAEFDVDHVTLTLKDVGYGPLQKVMFRVGGKSYYAEVTDRLLMEHDTIHVRLD